MDFERFWLRLFGRPKEEAQSVAPVVTSTNLDGPKKVCPNLHRYHSMLLDNFCRECGAGLVRLPHAVCGQCGNNRYREDKFCTKCGHKFKMVEGSDGMAGRFGEVCRTR